ncbi:MAG TPA: L-histidine N(alpha)-methyltransferase [Candidatus Binatia bacterium]|nr:L-histidine N(alpha)-methyltransferase [Candidatus Binatia bacterium]
MPNENSATLFSPAKRHLWRQSEPAVWSLEGGAITEDPRRSILTTLFDQPRWLEPYHLYDERGAELFERICDLPEYYLTRTENAILAWEAPRIIESAPVRCIVELGAGSAKKTTHLLEAQVRQHGSGIFAPIDVSLPGLRASRDAVRRYFPQIEFYGLHARYEDGVASIDENLPTLFVFLGSTIGNFRPDSFVRFFDVLSQAMGPRDYLLLGADRVKDVKTVEQAYADSQGVTAEFILNVFHAVNRSVGSNFDLGKMRYSSCYNPDWRQIEMYAVSTAPQEIQFPPFAASFHWERDEKILVEISRKFDPERLQQQLRFFALDPIDHYTDPNRWFSLLLFKKSS